jgi:drug/metabolite transporter (DMT)-like permease
MARSRTTGLVLGLLAAALWAPHFGGLSGALATGTPPLVFYFYVVFWAGLACVAALLVSGRVGELAVFRRRETALLLLTLAGGYGLWLLRALALERGGADLSALRVVFYSGPLLLGFLSIPGREGARAREMAALVLGLVGAIMIVSRPPGGADSAGPAPGLLATALGAGAALCWAAFCLGARRMLRSEGVLPVGAVLWCLGSALLLVTCLVTGGNVLAISPGGLWTSMWMGVVTVGLGLGCWLRCLSLVPPGSAAPLWYLSLVFGLVGGGLDGWWAVGGAALILVAVYASRPQQRRPSLSIGDVIRS